MKIRFIAVLALPVLLAVPARAQTVGEILVIDWRDAGKDVLSVWASPFDASRRDWLIAGAAFAVTGVSMLVDQPVSDWAIRNQDAAAFRAISPLRRGGVLFAGEYVVPPIALAYVAGVVFNNQGVRDFVTGCAASWAANSYLRKVSYRLVGRLRPDSVPDDPHQWGGPGSGDDWMMRSFPGGHVANAMACASYWNHRFEWGAGEPALYAVATAVGIGRLADEAHWFSDTVIGGVLGYAIGKEVARRSLSRRDAPSALQTSSMYMHPEAGGVTFGMRWTF
ncbi:MAG: phosphatase PAP2 family protein [Gemmatimonadaceae bacterium]